MKQPSSEAGETPTSFKLVGRITGPIRRSTLETDHLDPEWQSLTDVLSWAFCCRLQIARLRPGVHNPAASLPGR
jgi:hypothetical protein